MTFSIVGIDPAAGTCGSGVASFSVAVGGTVSYSRLGVGIINTQHFAHLALGNRVLDAMEKDGSAPHEALAAALTEDPGASLRQYVAMDPAGRQAGWTGSDCAPVARHAFGQGCVAAGNFLAGEEVVTDMIEAFEKAADRPLGERLLVALVAGERRGGDRRGHKAAALRVVPARDAASAINLDLRVDEHDRPLAELHRLKRAFEREFG